MKFDYSSLERAVAQLQKSFNYFHSSLARKNPDLREQFRAATIQAFENTYELAIKMIRRQLAQIVSNLDELHGINFADLMRIAADAGVIREAPAYFRYREIRNKTSHTYNIEQAERTVAEMDEFLRDVRFLLKELARRNRAAN